MLKLTALLFFYVFHAPNSVRITYSNFGRIEPLSLSLSCFGPPQHFNMAHTLTQFMRKERKSTNGSFYGKNGIKINRDFDPKFRF